MEMLGSFETGYRILTKKRLMSSGDRDVIFHSVILYFVRVPQSVSFNGD